MKVTYSPTAKGAKVLLVTVANVDEYRLRDLGFQTLDLCDQIIDPLAILPNRYGRRFTNVAEAATAIKSLPGTAVVHIERG